MTRAAKLLSAVFAAAVLAAPLRADEDITPDDIFGLMPSPIVTSVSRRAQSLRDAPSAVTVITAEEIRASGAKSVPDLLRSVPGLNVVQASGSEWAVTAHENVKFPGEGVLTLIDGRAATLDFFSVVLWESLPVTMDEIERIEVVKSPSSALWGANAMNGIINIVTKSPARSRGFSTAYGAGGQGLQSAAALHGGEAGLWDYRVSAGYEERPDFPNPLTGRDGRATAGTASKGNALLTRDLGRAGRFSLRAGGAAGTGETLTALGAFRRDGGAAYVQAVQEGKSWRAQVYHNAFDIDLSAPGFPTGPVRTGTTDGEFQHTAPPFWGQTLTWGADGRDNAAHAPTVIGGDRHESRWAVFLQDEVAPWRPLKLTAGGRFDDYSVGKGFLSARFGAVWTPHADHVLRASSGRSFNKPDTIDHFADVAVTRDLRQLNPALPSVPFTATLKGDRGLAPERVDALEVGYQNTTFRRLTARLDAFLKKQRDDVVPTVVDTYPANALFPGSPGGVIPRTLLEENVGLGRVWGGEASLDLAVREGWLLFANYSLQRESGVLLGTAGPKNKANLGTRMRWARDVTFTSTAHYVDLRRFDLRTQPTPPRSSLTLPSYATVDARLAWQVTPRLEAAVAGWNLFNDKHREYVDADVLDRRVMGTVRVEF